MSPEWGAVIRSVGALQAALEDWRNVMTATASPTRRVVRVFPRQPMTSRPFHEAARQKVDA